MSIIKLVIVIINIIIVIVIITIVVIMVSLLLPPRGPAGLGGEHGLHPALRRVEGADPPRSGRVRGPHPPRSVMKCPSWACRFRMGVQI